MVQVVDFWITAVGPVGVSGLDSLPTSDLQRLKVFNASAFFFSLVVIVSFQLTLSLLKQLCSVLKAMCAFVK